MKRSLAAATGGRRRDVEVYAELTLQDEQLSGCPAGDERLLFRQLRASRLVR